MKLKQLLQSFIISLLLIATPVLSQCDGEKDCSIYTGDTLMSVFQGTLCGIFNFMVCVGPPMYISVFYGVLATLIVSIFAFMAYMLAGE